MHRKGGGLSQVFCENEVVYGLELERGVLVSRELAGTLCPCQKDPDAGVVAAGETGEPLCLAVPCAYSIACP